MWDKQMAVGKKQVVKKSKEKQINCICKIKKVGKDLVFNLGDGSTDLITLTTNYIELKDDKLWEVKAKEWKSGGVWQGVDRLKMRNMKKKLTPIHEVALGSLKLQIDIKDKNRALGKVLSLVTDMIKMEKKIKTTGDFF